ncbi:MAG: hypothetical protein KGD64_04870, partial [Candidatus Heimdallarchaeota archaeon]|nr:hypothetical protein [Candidatus Heimdallarchaeota archaeon]
MENNGNSDGVETLDIIDIADEIVKLTEEVKALKSKVRLTQAHESKKGDAPSNTNALDINPAIAYINEMLQSSSKNIISELKAEFFRLFNFLSSIQTVSPYQRNREQSKSKQIAIEDEFT